MEPRRTTSLILLTCLLLLVMPAATAYSGPCPIGTSGAPYLINPGISSGALCRGACGQDCPPDRCELLKDSEGNMQPLTIVIQNPRGVCTYNNVLECPSHTGCQIHDACFDKCADRGMNSMTDSCHMTCNKDCLSSYGLKSCVLWADAPTLAYNNAAAGMAGYVLDQVSGVDFSGYYFFSDPPEFKAVTPTPTKTPTPTITTIKPVTALITTKITTTVPTTTTAIPITSGGPMTLETEPPLAVQRQKCADAGGKWDYFSEGCTIPSVSPSPAPVLPIPDIFKDKPTIQYTPQDFQDAADDAAKNGNYDLAVQYINAAEAIYLKNNPDKSTRPADVDRSLAALETSKAKVFRSWPGHDDQADEAAQNVKTLNADALSKESSWDLPGFEAAAGILAFGLCFLLRRTKQ